MHRAEGIHTLHQKRESLEAQFSLLQRTKTKESALDRINIVGFIEQRNNIAWDRSHWELHGGSAQEGGKESRLGKLAVKCPSSKVS